MDKDKDKDSEIIEIETTINYELKEDNRNNRPVYTADIHDTGNTYYTSGNGSSSTSYNQSMGSYSSSSNTSSPTSSNSNSSSNTSSSTSSNSNSNGEKNEGDNTTGKPNDSSNVDGKKEDNNGAKIAQPEKKDDDGSPIPDHSNHPNNPNNLNGENKANDNPNSPNNNSPADNQNKNPNENDEDKLNNQSKKNDSNNPQDDNKSGEQLSRNPNSSHNKSNNNDNNNPSNFSGGRQPHQRPNFGAKPHENQMNNNDSKETKTATSSSSDSSSTSGGKKNGDVGSRNLRNSLANKTRNLLNQRKKKKKKDDDSKDNDNSSENGNNEDEKGDDNQLLSKDEKIKLKRKIYIRIAILGAAFFFIYCLVMIIASALTGGGVFKIAPAESYKKFEEEDFQPVTSKDSEAYEDEIKFYKKVKEASGLTYDLLFGNHDEENENEEGEPEEKITTRANMNYVVAILLNLYYEYNPSYVDIEPEEAERLKDSAGIDYKHMTEYVELFVREIVKTKADDYEIEGIIYYALVDNEIFNEYYSDVLKYKDRHEILQDAFKLAQELDVDEMIDDTVLTSETEVETPVSPISRTYPPETVKPTSTPTITPTVKPTPTPTISSKPLTIGEYLSGSIYANDNIVSSPERVKAYTIVYSTNLVASNKNLTITNNVASASNVVCSVAKGCSYDSNNNLVEGGGARNSKNSIYYNGAYYYKKPLSSSEQTTLNSTINSVFGVVLIDSSGSYPKLDISKLGGYGDGDYKTILKNAYGNYQYKNIGENSYVLDVNYGNKKVLTEVIFYDQKDYPNTKFCGRNGLTIGGSGCGVTAMAIVASTYEKNKKFDPPYMSEEARKRGLCGYDGTAQAFFGKEASAMKYKYMGGSKYNKSLLNSVLKHLSQGHLVVVRMGSGHFTSGGHYMVLGGIDPETKKVYVYDPNNRSNKSYRKTGNGWYSFNDMIVKEAYNFYIIWKG